MSNLVPSEDIETFLASPRHPTRHLARAVSANQTVYILHSKRCLDSGIDLRDCVYSLALDEGIDLDRWEQDKAVHAIIEFGMLVPCEYCELPYLVEDDDETQAEWDEMEGR